MKSRSLLSLLCLIASLTGAGLLMSCARSEEAAVKTPAAPMVEQPIPVARPTAEPSLAKAALPPLAPEPDDVRRAVTRIYKETVVFDAAPGNFLQGDFNGDGSPDIAVVVRPAVGMLPELNHELANWIRGEPQRVLLPQLTKDGLKLPPRPEPVKIEEGDLLLAVIHGYGPAGWRAPQARQSYLLRKAVGSNLQVEKAERAIGAHKGKAKTLSVRGDVIKETLAGQSGFIYYTGAKYAWYH